MFFAVYQANSSRSACTRKGHGSNLVHARAFHTGYSQAHWGFSDCCFEVDKDIRQNTLWKTCARWCHHCWTRRNVALSRVKKNKLWIWKAYRRETGELIDWECGGRDKGTLSKLMERLSRWKVELFCTDNWGVYPEVIVADKLYQSKSQTVYLEQNNGRQRHWFARFRRKSIVVSKTLEMVDLTMALFARFHVNGSWKDIASLFSWHPPSIIGVRNACHSCFRIFLGSPTHLYNLATAHSIFLMVSRSYTHLLFSIKGRRNHASSTNTYATKNHSAYVQRYETQKK